MSASVWHRADIGRIGQTLIDVAPSYEFAAGVGALCKAVGAPVVLPEPRGVTVVMIEPGDNGRQVVTR